LGVVVGVADGFLKIKFQNSEPIHLARKKRRRNFRIRGFSGAERPDGRRGCSAPTSFSPKNGSRIFN